METKERLGAFHDLLDDRFHEADYAHLRKLDPKHEVFKSPTLSTIQYREALFGLIDLITPEEIKKHRKAHLAKLAKEAAQKKAAAQLAEKEELLKLLEEGKLKKFTKVVNKLPDDHLFLDDLVNAGNEAAEAKKKADEEKVAEEAAAAEKKADEEVAAAEKAAAEKKAAEEAAGAEKKAAEAASTSADTPAKEPAKKKASAASGGSSKKSTSTRGSGGTS